MKKIGLNFRRPSIVLFGLLYLVLAGCKNDITPSLYNENAKGSPEPVITSIVPTGDGLAGVSTYTIAGSNFSTVKDDNTVYFDAVAGTIVSCNATQIVVTASAVVRDSVVVRVKVKGSFTYSNPKYVNLKPAVEEFGTLDKTEEPNGLACDTAGNLYVSIIKNSAGAGIRNYADSGTYTTYCVANGVTFWSGLKIGPGGLLYAVRNARAMYTIAKGGAPLLFAQRIGAAFSDLDFDKYHNVWTGGSDTSIYRIRSSDKTIKAFPFVGIVRSVRVFNDYVYVAARVDSIEGIYRFKIVSADSVSPSEQYFILSGKPGYIYNGFGALAITFNSDGDMYVGTNSPDAMLLVHPDLSYEKYYSGLLSPNAISFAWGKGGNLYVSRGGAATHVMIKIKTQKTSAPYYGRGDL